MATWPLSLPQRLLFDGFGQEIQNNTLRSPMDVGPAKLRRRSMARYRPTTGTVIVTKAQLLTFILFFENEAQQGSLPFDWVDPIFDTVESFRFVEPPSWVPYGLRFKVSLSLEMRVVGLTLPLNYVDTWSLGMVESTGTIVPTSP